MEEVGKHCKNPYKSNILFSLEDVLAFPEFVVENGSPVLENVSEHTRVAIITVSVSPPTSLIGDPVIVNANPVVHPFVLSRRSTHQWEVSIEANSIITWYHKGSKMELPSLLFLPSTHIV